MFAQTGDEMDFNGIWITAADIPAICELTGTHRTTVARWLEKGVLPLPVHRLLDLIYNGNLGRIHPDWDGFSIDPRTGRLDNPSGRYALPGDIMALPYRHHMIAHLRGELRVLEAEHASDAAQAGDVLPFSKVSGDFLGDD